MFALAIQHIRVLLAHLQAELPEMLRQGRMAWQQQRWRQ
jgi:hypothetical protein